MPSDVLCISNGYSIREGDIVQCSIMNHAPFFGQGEIIGWANKPTSLKIRYQGYDYRLDIHPDNHHFIAPDQILYVISQYKKPKRTSKFGTWIKEKGL